ncbi:hypothetical protein [Kutzneria buriramensis]|uniref:Uncharacterized protein n=1 Tax=Kutzneria buriramensis TaxID=1045776 RepID=A0A3E0GVH2_9PSEU|nr:hypothetical protein [Kutzneria buriramensis]REH30650.1 hypothetical protein BCF44_1238 [Kutzneria buriramensis]
MFVQLYRQYLGLLVMSILYAAWASTLRGPLLVNTLHFWTNHAGAPKRRLWLARTTSASMWLVLSAISFAFGTMTAFALYEFLHSVPLFWVMVALPAVGVLLNLGVAVWTYPMSRARLGDRSGWAEALGEDRDAALEAIARTDCANVASRLWWAYFLMLPAIWPFAVCLGMADFAGDGAVAGQGLSGLAAIAAGVTSVALLAALYFGIDLTSPHLGLVLVGLSVMRPAGSPHLPPLRTLRPGRWRVGRHWTGFRIARQLERCAAATGRRLDATDADLVRRVFGAVAIDLRRGSLSATTDSVEQAQFVTLTRYAIAVLAVDDPVALAAKGATVVTAEMPETPGARNLLEAAGTMLASVSDRIDAVRKVLVGTAVIAAALWLVISGHLADFRTLR